MQETPKGVSPAQETPMQSLALPTFPHMKVKGVSPMQETPGNLRPFPPSLIYMVKDVSCEHEVRLKENSEISRKPTMCTNRNLIFLSIEKGWHAEVFVRGNPTKHRFWWKLFERNSEILLLSCRVAQECVYWLLRYRFKYMFSMRMPYFRFNGASASHVIQFNIQKTCNHEQYCPEIICEKVFRLEESAQILLWPVVQKRFCRKQFWRFIAMKKGSIACMSF